MTALLTSWQLYGMVAAGILGMFLLQSPMNAGRLVAAQPGLTLTDPLVSILWGVLVFREQVRTGWFLVLTIVGGLVIVGAVLDLARSPLLSGASRRDEQPQAEPAISSTTDNLERAFGVGNTQIGLLLTVMGLVGPRSPFRPAS
jgi:hypothetical protein